MGGCGGNCACARAASDAKDEVCPAPKGGVASDKDGLCPCGKVADECCLPVRSQTQAGHKGSLKKSPDQENPALNELCKPHGKRHLCG